MAAGGQFQLFPPSRTKSNRDTNPFRRGDGKRLSVVSTAISPIVKNATKDNSPEAVVIQVYKEISPVQEPEQAHMASLQAVSPSRPTSKPALKLSIKDQGKRTTLSGVPILPITDTPNLPPPPPLQNNKDSFDGRSPRRDGPTVQPSPVVAMRSLFPRYNPGVPLAKQSYYPQRVAGPENVPQQAVSRHDYSPSVSSVSRIDELIGGPKTAPASILNFPLDALDVRAPEVSTVEELHILWEAANGQGPEIASESYILPLTRLAEATFTFGTSPGAPFYTLETFANNELSISRTHPAKAKMTVPILHLCLEPPAHSVPQHGSSTDLLAKKGRELITYIFPKLAAMLAIDQSDELATKHHLAPTVKVQMQSEAVARAAAQEASRLYWNESDKRYELDHPALGKQQPMSPIVATSTEETTAQQASEQRHVLHITITSPDDSPDPSSSSPSSPCFPTIAILNPLPSGPSPAGTPPLPSRASTVPLPDTTNDTLPPPLASLAFPPSGPILNIDTHAITTLLPSLYAIDSLVSALFSIAVADALTNSLLADLPIYDPWAEYKKTIPVPTARYAGSVAGASTVGGKSYAGSVFYATQAEREEAEEEARLMRQLHKKDVKGKSRKSLAMSLKSFAAMDAVHEEDDLDYDLEKAPASRSKFGWKSKDKKRKKARTHKVTIQEFDLEKYGTYQSGSREGQKLPGPTRAALEAMFMVLKFLVWIMTLFVSVLAKVLVTGTRAVTSERF